MKTITTEERWQKIINHPHLKKDINIRELMEKYSIDEAEDYQKKWEISQIFTNNFINVKTI